MRLWLNRGRFARQVPFLGNLRLPRISLPLLLDKAPILRLNAAEARKGRPARLKPTEDRMFYAKMHDDEDDELPRYEEEEEGLEQPHDGDIIEEVEEIVVEAEPGEDEAEAPA